MNMEWISVKDGLPEIFVPVQIITDYGKQATAYLTDPKTPSYGWSDWMRPQHGYGSVTHWMPLPEPPK